MKIEEICQKLRPILGRKIDALYFRYRFEANNDRKKRLEQILLLLYEQNVDQLLNQSKVLLPPPNPSDAKGEYNLGEVLYDDKPVCSFGLKEHEFLRHIGLFGITGTGKSNVVFKLIDELISHGKKVFIFDWKRQYRDYLTWKPNADVLIFGAGTTKVPSFQFNPLIPPPGIEPAQYQETVAEIVAAAFYCGQGVISLLRTAISVLYEEYGIYEGRRDQYPTFSEVLEYVKTMDHRGRSRDWKDSALRALEAICHGGLGRMVNVHQPTMELSKLLEQNVFLELGDLGQSQKSFIIQSLLFYLYFYTMHRGIKEKLQNVIIIEEAHHILREQQTGSKEPIAEVVCREIREFSTGLICVDQSPSTLSLSALANAYATIGMYTKHGSDISALSRAMFLDEDQKPFLGRLPTGTGIVKLAGRIFDPFLVRFPLVPIRKGVISDADVCAHMAQRGFFIELGAPARVLEAIKRHDAPFGNRAVVPPGIPENRSIEEYLGAEEEAQAGREPGSGDPDPYQSEDCRNFSYSAQVGRDSTQRSTPDGDSADSAVIPPASKHHGDNKEERWIKTLGAEQAAGEAEGADARTPLALDVSLFQSLLQAAEKMGAAGTVGGGATPEAEPATTRADSRPRSLHSIAFFEDVLRYPFDGSASRNRRLGISPRKGKAAAEDLCRQGLLSRIDVQELKGRRTLYEPTKDGKLFALSKGLHGLLTPDQHGGVEHRFWNDRIARLNKEAGWQVTLEVPIKGDGTVDQLVTKDGRTVVVEIETGKSRPGRTLRRNLEQGFARVVVAATSDEALAVVKEQVKKEGLAGDGRVRVVKANAYSPSLLE